MLPLSKIDIFSGFLGAGKTTLIKKLIKEAYAGEKLVLVENEFGEIGIDGGFLKEAGIEITEMNSGCICCSLVGDFTEALQKVLEEFRPDRILIEPSGVGKLSDVIRAVRKVESSDVKLNSFTTIADATKCRVYIKNFGEFYNDQVANAGCIVLSRTDGMTDEKVAACIELLRQHNAEAVIVTTPWPQLDGKQILSAMERENTLADTLAHLEAEDCCPVCGEHHHHRDEECHHHDHEHHHHDGEDCDCHEHHHDHEGHCDDECHSHHHKHHHHHHHNEEECHCHDHEHEHHHHHHADDVFASWGVETANRYTDDEILQMLNALEDEHKYGMILRAKGIVSGVDGSWIHFDYVPGAPDVRKGGADVIGRLCVIGADICEHALAELFRVPHKH